jgi:hypothetical protein
VIVSKRERPWANLRNLQETAMTLEDWANIGEIVGGVAVIISLLYLAWQIRQNTKAVRATAVDSSINYSMGVRQSIFENKEITHSTTRVSRPPCTLRGGSLPVSTPVPQHASFSLEHLLPIATRGSHERDLDSQRHVIKRMLSSEGGRWFWENYRQEFEASFQVEVDAILSEP